MEPTKKRVSFRQKNATRCPVCGYEFHKEEMLSGGGRLIAGNLTDELRRKYEETKKFGKIYPLSYLVTVCPKCLYSSYPADFNELSGDEILKIRNLFQTRHDTIKKFFGDISFEDDRNLILGAASYMLVVDIYGLRDKNVAPTFKCAVSSIRAAWLFNDLSKIYPDDPYKKIAGFFYKKAYNFYDQVINLVQNGNEPVEAAGNMGPDTDKNWGYDGILYIYAVLTMKIGYREKDLKKRIDNFEKTKRYLSRIFGIGKTSKKKPGVIMDMIRDLYDKMNEMLDKWNKELESQSEE